MKTNLCPRIPALPLAILFCVLGASPVGAAGEIEEAFRDALYAEEVKGDLESALKAYQDVGARFELQRDLAAAALFREGECLRKLGRKEAAIAIYQKVLARYSDKERIAKLSRENLAALGQAPPASALPDAPGGLTEEEAKELARLQTLAQNSPDLLGHGNPTPLQDAVTKGHTAVVAWLLNHLPKQAPETLGGRLADAATRGHLKICDLLVDAGASISGHGALHYALKANRVAVARFLLGHKTDVNEHASYIDLPIPIWESGIGRSGNRPQYSYSGVTPLMIAAASNGTPPEFVSDLLKAGAKIDSIADTQQRPFPNRPGGSPAEPLRNYHFTALGAAIAVGEPEKVRMLIQAGADVNQIAGELDATPLLLALAMAREEDVSATTDPILKSLLAAGADWKARLSTGATALHLAGRRRLRGWVAEAINAGVDVKAVDRSGFTALHDAADSSSAEIVRALVAAGANPNVTSTQSSLNVTPLSIACLQPREARGLETIKALLEGGADPNREGSGGRRPLSLACPSLFIRTGCWPEAMKLLIEHGARPGEAKIFAKQQVGGVDFSSIDEATIDAFRMAWKAAYWRDNPRLPHAVWLSRSESALKAGQEPSFVAILCDESAAGPPTLRDVIGVANQPVDWSKVTIIRQKNGTELILPVDVLALAAEAEPKDFPLEWGDVVEAPVADLPPAGERAKEKLKPWLEHGARADLRVQLGHQRFVANADGAKGPVVSIQKQFRVDPATVMRTAGLTSLFFTIEGVRTTQRDGTLGAIEPPDFLRHGDILVLSGWEPQPKLSDTALRSGIWLCHTLDGPFWPVAPQQDILEEAVPLGGLVAALLGPHPLPSPAIAWEKAIVRFVAEENEWQEKNLLEAWPTLKLQPGTVVILPPAELDNFEPPAELRAPLANALAIEWNLAIGQQPLITSRWEPRFFRGKSENGTWVWRDLDPAKVGRPVLPVLYDLLAAHPDAGAFKNGQRDPLSFSVKGRASSDQLRNATGRWMPNEKNTPVINVSEADKPTSSTRSDSAQGPPPNKRRVTLPPPQ